MFIDRKDNDMIILKNTPEVEKIYRLQVTVTKRLMTKFDQEKFLSHIVLLAIKQPRRAMLG